MKFVFRPYCGNKLVNKRIGDEGLVPYCEKCRVLLSEALSKLREGSIGWQLVKEVIEKTQKGS